MWNSITKPHRNTREHLFFSHFLGSWTCEVWASTEESHWALSWFGNVRSFCDYCIVITHISITFGTSFNRVLTMITWVCLAMMTTHCKTLIFCMILSTCFYVKSVKPFVFPEDKMCGVYKRLQLTWVAIICRLGSHIFCIFVCLIIYYIWLWIH